MDDSNRRVAPAIVAGGLIGCALTGVLATVMSPNATLILGITLILGCLAFIVTR